MLISDSNPNLALALGNNLDWNAVPYLTTSCDPSYPNCTWTYENGKWYSNWPLVSWIGTPIGRGSFTAVSDPPAFGDTVYLSTTSTHTWTMPNVMFTPSNIAPATLPAVVAIRATGQDGTGDAVEAGKIVRDYSCQPNNPNCTWTMKQGLVLNDSNPSLGLNAWYGAGSGLLTVTGLCDVPYVSNPDCRWHLASNHIGTDNGDELIQYSTKGDPNMTLPHPCTGPYCFMISTNFSMTRAGD
jgi:hypothetical protein